jgi:hypothetical protein
MKESQGPRDCDTRLSKATKKYLPALFSAKVAQAQQNPHSRQLLRGLASILGVAEGEVGAMRQLLLWPPSEPPPTAESSSFLLPKRLRVAQLVEEALKAIAGPALAD